METRKMIVGIAIVVLVANSVNVFGQAKGKTSVDARALELGDLLRSAEGIAKVPPRISKTKDGYLRFIGAAPSTHFPVEPAKRVTAEEAAGAFLAKRRNLFLRESPAVEFDTIRVKRSNGRGYVRYQQTYAGLDVFGAQMTVQVNAGGGIECVLSDIMRDTEPLDSGAVSLNPTIGALGAQRAAIGFLAKQNEDLEFEASDAKLMIYSPSVVGYSGNTQLVWQTEVGNTGDELLVKENILVDAHSGEIAFHYPLIYNTIYREVWDYNSTQTAVLVLRENDGNYPSGITDVDNTWRYLEDMYDFYYNHHNRLSYDNNDANLVAKVRYNEKNAYCYISYIILGNGFATDDVVAHEFTHSVTALEAELIYSGQSGAIHESFSDMWGEWIDLTNSDGNDINDVRWLLGEDITPDGAVRNMANPPDFNHPDRMGSPYYYHGKADKGGVHINNGVGNKLCYLLTDGDTFNGHTISAMDINTTADLFYECQTNLLTSASDYEDLYQCVVQAGINLGLSQADVNNIIEAGMAVEIYPEGHWFVSPDGDNSNGLSWATAFTTIQQGINAASNGDTINVAEGTYYESIDFNGVSCTLTGTDPNDWGVVAATIIDANDPNADAVMFNSGEDANAVLKGLTVTGAWVGVYADSVGPVISRCILHGSRTGVKYTQNSTGTLVVNNKIYDCNGYGVFGHKGDATIKSNWIYDSDKGIKLAAGASADIYNNTIVNNISYGIDKGGGGTATISNCIIWDCNDDLYGCSATYSCIEDGNAGTGNISSDPCFVDADSNDFHLSGISPCIDTGDPNGDYSGEEDIDSEQRVMRGRVDMGADEFFRVHNITKNTWYINIQDAIYDANDANDAHDIIKAYTGTYNETIDFNGISCTLTSTDPNDWDVVSATIIDANGSAYPAVYFDSNEDANSVLVGFMIRNNGYHGAYCNGTSPVIRRCIIEKCSTGIYCGGTASPTIINNIVRHNTNKGIQVTPNSTAEIKNNWIYRNDTGIRGRQFIVRNTTIAYNTDFGIMKGIGTPNSTVVNCIFWGHDGNDLGTGFSATYSCIEDCNDASGTGNICGDGNDPNFVNPDANDFHIDPNSSPCIDAGDPAGGDYYGQTDIDGDVRVMTLEVDMGADEAAYFPPGHPDYNEWVAVGEPNCWCYRRQCHSDTDNTKNGDTKQGYFYIGGDDLNLLIGNWCVKEPPKGSGIVYLGEPNMCADVDHAQAGTAKGGYYRVGATDLNILATYWNIKEPPDGSGVDPNCFE